MFICRAYRDGLENEGFEVSIALNGVEGFKQAVDKKPDLVLLDLILPVKDGFEVLEDLKADPELQKIPVVVLTNLGQDSDVTKCMDLGAADYMVKANVSLKDVLEKVKEILYPESNSEPAHEGK